MYVFVFEWGRCSTPSVAQWVESSTVVVDTVRGILRNRLVTSSILVVRTSFFTFTLFTLFTLFACIAFVYP